MKSKEQYLCNLSEALTLVKETAEKEFYYLEIEELRWKRKPEQWSIVEVIAHLNMVNGYYLKNISKALDKSTDSAKETYKQGWLGKLFINMMAPKGGKRPFKMRTLKKVNPLESQKNGVVIVERIVFADFLADIEEFLQLIERAKSKDISTQKLPTFAMFLKLPIGDALGFAVAHTQRHLVQAQKMARKEA